MAVVSAVKRYGLRTRASKGNSSRLVAQTGSLLYRGLGIRGRGAVERSADCQSAIRQIGNLRYSGSGPVGDVDLDLRI